MSDQRKITMKLLECTDLHMPKQMTCIGCVRWLFSLSMSRGILPTRLNNNVVDG